MKTRLTALVWAATLATASESDRVAPKRDFLIAVQDTTLQLTAAELLANDGLPGPPSAYRIAITAAPGQGTLTPTASGYAYRPSTGYFGADQFTYTVEGAPSPVSSVVRIEVAPDYLGLTVDFDGDGYREWGWFDSAAATFHACEDYPGPAPRCTMLWAAPAGLAGTAPIVGDWNGDRREDVGLFDARTGWFHLRTLGGWPSTRSFPLGVGGGVEVPLAGDWNGDRRATVGLYRPAEARFVLRNQNASGPFDYDFTFGGYSPDRRALTVRWPELGVDAVALHIGPTLHLYAPKGGQRQTKPVDCPPSPRIVAIEYGTQRGFVVYDLVADVARRCSRLSAPVTVYLPPDAGSY